MPDPTAAPSDSGDRLPELDARLDALDGEPVASHADLLEALRAALVTELDAAARRAAAAEAGGPGSAGA